jgi:hypothetical protein
MATQIIQMILPLVCIGDEITDIWYLISNWDSFGNEALKIASLVFVVFPFLLIVLLEGYQFSQHKSRTCFFLDVFLIWTKIE